MRFFSERLRDDHVLSEFDSGNDALDDWLRSHARHADRVGTGRTYVWTDEEGAVVAYFTLTPHVVRRDEVPKRVERGSPDAIQAILLARLALAASLQGGGWGGVLLTDVLGVAVEAVTKVGGRLIVVDAVDPEAADFYEHHGFLPVPGNPHRLVMKASDAARTLGIAPQDPTLG